VKNPPQPIAALMRWERQAKGERSMHDWNISGILSVGKWFEWEVDRVKGSSQNLLISKRNTPP
jgi:hypothetical protein